MRYLSMYGSDGFRTFTGVLNGLQSYAPDKIPTIDPEIIIERAFDVRLEAIVAPFTDNHPSLKTILPVISSKIGTLQKISDKYSLWSPQYHLSYLSHLLLASLLEEFNSQDELSFIALNEDNGEAFCKAFSLEKKVLYFPENTETKIQSQTSYKFYNPEESNFYNKLSKSFKLRLDHSNIFRIVGHMGTILEALYQTEVTHQRFYNDPVSLVLPADSVEYLLAGYYLSKSKFPIKNIYAISQNHRMVHQFLQKGEFKISNKSEYDLLEISLDRMLFELARGSVEKLVSWKKELATNGSFRIDSTALESLKIFKSYFANPNTCKEIQEEFDQPVSKIALYGKLLSKELSEHVLAFDL